MMTNLENTRSRQREPAHGRAHMAVRGRLHIAGVLIALMMTVALLPLMHDAYADSSTPGALEQEVQDLRREVLALNRDLFMLEEELLFPASTQVSVFVSMDVGEFFALDAVTLRLNGRAVAHHVYTNREVQALIKGGVQRLYLGNLRAGEHELIAVFTGLGPRDREYRRAATLRFEKGLDAKFVELSISDRASRLQPEFVIREWE